MLVHYHGRQQTLILLLESSTPGSTDYFLSEDETGFDAVMLEDSDAYYTFVVIQEAFSLATQDTQSENEWFEDRATGKIGDPVLDFTESVTHLVILRRVYNVRTIFL